MARGLAIPINGAPRGQIQNGDLPPSTLAAQLLHRMEETPGKLRQDEVTFRQLLKEVLDTQDEPTSSASESSDTLLTNYKLIFVIVKVGLDPGHQHGQSSDQNESVKQAMNCLKAIMQTIQRTPSILFIPPNASDQLISDPPMFLWLIPKLLLLTTLSNSDDFKVACESCLLTLLSLEGKLALKGVKPHALRRFLALYLQGT